MDGCWWNWDILHSVCFYRFDGESVCSWLLLTTTFTVICSGFGIACLFLTKKLRQIRTHLWTMLTSVTKRTLSVISVDSKVTRTTSITSKWETQQWKTIFIYNMSSLFTLDISWGETSCHTSKSFWLLNFHHQIKNECCRLSLLSVFLYSCLPLTTSLGVIPQHPKKIHWSPKNLFSASLSPSRFPSRKRYMCYYTLKQK